jgi:hypothetical protein
MKPPDPIKITLPHRHPDRSEWRPDSPAPDIPDCPGCGGPLALAPAGPDDPDRLVGTCPARRCREGAVIFRRLEGRWIVQDRRPRSRTRSSCGSESPIQGGRPVDDPNRHPDAGGGHGQKDRT